MTDTSPEAVERLAALADGFSDSRSDTIRGPYPISTAYLRTTAVTFRALAAENARLRAENATAYQRGAEAMREAAADAFGHDMTGKLLAASIRALPIPDQPKEGA